MRVTVALFFVLCAAGENPISKVVRLLQGLQSEVEKEGQDEKKLYDKFMCYCNSNDGQLKTDIQNEEAHISELTSLIEETAASNGQLESDVKDLEEDIDDAHKAVADATKVREKEAAEFDSEAEDLQASIDALEMAIPAIQRGQGQGQAFTQLSSKLAPGAMRSDRNQVLMRALIQEANGAEAPSSQILGILQQMEENFREDLAKAKEEEQDARTTFSDLNRAKVSELSSLTSQRDDKKARIADQKLTLATAQEDLEDTKVALAKDQDFASTMKKSCADKTTQWEQRQGTRAEEIEAISQTIGILNADDARDLFKQTLPSPSAPPVASFLQMRMTSKMHMATKLHDQADQLDATASTAAQYYESASHQQHMSAISQSMRTANSADKFASIKKMVTEMVDNLNKEQVDDDKHNQYCQDELATKNAKKAKLIEELELLQGKIGNLGTSITSTDDEMATLKKEITNLDKSVAEATEARKAENQEFTQTQSELQVAIDLLHKAKDRMAAFYAPTPAPEGPSFLGIGLSFVQMKSPDVLTEFLQQASGADITSAQQAKPPPAPDTFGDKFEKKTGASMGVMALLDNLAHDCQMQMQEGKSGEDESQRNYEKMMSESAATREAKANAIADKETERVRLLETLGQGKEEKTDDMEELKAVGDNIAALHESCDFLIQNYDFRKKARANELDGLKQGLAVLGGANFGGEQAPAQ